MLINVIEEMLPSVMKSGDKNRLEAIKDIKNELKKAIIAVNKDYQLSKDEEDKILVKMVNQYEEAISEFKKGGAKPELIADNEARLEVIKEFAPKIATDEEIADLTKTVINDLLKSKGDGYTLSMRDMGTIKGEVNKIFPNANGKIISTVLKSYING